MGFLVICSGVILLQLAKSSKDVPDAAVFKGDLDQVRTVAEQEEPEYEPRADTIRGGAGIVRAMSRIRTKRQVDEVKRIHHETMEPIGEGEEFEWDGLRRRKTSSTAHSGSVKRTKTVHPPLGMSHFPDENESTISEPDSEVHPGFFGRIGRKSHTTFGSQAKKRTGRSPVPLGSVHGVASHETDLERGEGDGEVHTFGLPPGLQRPPGGADEDTAYKGPGGPSSTHIHFASDVEDRDRASSQGSNLAPPRPPLHASGTGGAGAKRQFSFTNVFHRKHSDGAPHNDPANRPTSRGALSFISGHNQDRPYPSYPGTSGDGATEEERLGLVHGDSSKTLPKYSEVVPEEERDSDEWQVTSGSGAGSSPQDVGGDLGVGGRQRRRDDGFGDEESVGEDEMESFDEPLRSPIKEYEYQSERRGGGGSGEGGAFV